MATYTSNYGWTKPSGSDNVDISVLNNNLDNQDSTIHDAFLNMAPPFSESSTYAVDDIVLYGTGLYKCHTAVVTPGSWTGSTNWQVYRLSEGGGGGLTLGETSSTAYRGDRGKVAYDHSQTTGNPHGTTASDVGLGNVPNVSTNDQTPTFSEASTRNNIASGEKLSVILGKIQKFFNDLKSVAYSGSYTDLSNQPQINGNTLSGNKTTSDLGINADNVMMSDGVTSVEDAVEKITRNKYINSTMSPQASVSANTKYMTHKLVIPEAGTYLVMGEILGIGGNIALDILVGDTESGTDIANTWTSQNKCIFTVTVRNANDILSLWLKPDSNQTFYADSKCNKFFAIKLL